MRRIAGEVERQDVAAQVTGDELGRLRGDEDRHDEHPQRGHVGVVGI